VEETSEVSRKFIDSGARHNSNALTDYLFDYIELFATACENVTDRWFRDTKHALLVKIEMYILLLRYSVKLLPVVSPEFLELRSNCDAILWQSIALIHDVTRNRDEEAESREIVVQRRAQVLWVHQQLMEIGVMHRSVEGLTDPDGILDNPSLVPPPA